MKDKHGDGKPGAAKRVSPKIIIVGVVATLFAGVVLAKAASYTPSAPSPAPTGTATGVAATPPGASTITSVHNDAVADYEAALKTGKPVYVLFHSLTCQPCVEISKVVDEVMPAYEGKVVFVNAISDDPSAQQLASSFQFQYIPTSFFIAPDGSIVDSFTGSMNETEIKARLDRLTAQ